MAMILRTWTVDQVIALARQLDPGLEDADFADAGQRLDNLDDGAFARYGLGPADVTQLRNRFATWPRTAPPRRDTAGEMPGQYRGRRGGVTRRGQASLKRLPGDRRRLMPGE
jgi:hypothetical protein